MPRIGRRTPGLGAAAVFFGAWGVVAAAERIEAVPFDAPSVEVADPEFSVTPPDFEAFADLTAGSGPGSWVIGADGQAGQLAPPPLDAQQFVVAGPGTTPAPPVAANAPPAVAAPPASGWAQLGQSLTTATPAQRLGLTVASVLALGAALVVLLETRRFARWKSGLTRHAADPTAAGRCESCGYLIAISFQDACPECGSTRVFLHPRTAAGWVWAYLRHRRYGT